MRFDGRVAIVTGAGSGMGRATALRLAAEGATVVAADISGDERATASVVGDRAVAVGCDVTREADWRALVDGTVERFGRLDVLCNVAGITGEIALIAEATVEDFDRVLDVNLRGVWLGMRHALPAMVAGGGGAIVNWASLGGLIGVPAMSPYLASKGGVVQVTRGAALEYGRHGVRVNAVCPGHIETPMTEQVGAAFARASEAARESTARLMADNATRGALGRNGTADEVAAAAAFLASDDASFLTGVALPVDGGRLAG